MDAADEFLTAARWAAVQGHVRPLIDNLFSAVELLAKAQLFLRPDETLLRPKIGHKFIRSEFNRWFGCGENAEPEYKDLLNELADCRSETRYVHDALDGAKESSLVETDHQRLLTQAEEFRAWVAKHIPTRHAVLQDIETDDEYSS